MLTFLVGHRGVGKTSLLKRIKKYLNGNGQFFDLDQEVERKTGVSTFSFFEQHGEKKFRSQEIEALGALLEKLQTDVDVFIAVGAGFEGKFPQKCRVIWVRRQTDEQGRIFFNRPRLDLRKSALNEFLERKKSRDQRYLEQSHFSLFLREGVEDYDAGEESFFLGRPDNKGLCTYSHENKSAITYLFCELLEVRDDFSAPVDDELHNTSILYSYRDSKRKSSVRPKSLDEYVKLKDWALELGEPSPDEEFDIISLHERKYGVSLGEFFEKLELFGKEKILKAAPIVESFCELYEGFCWQQKQPNRRVFLPRSKNGRWMWFRLFMKEKMPLNFWRLGKGSAIDQPFLLHWLNTQKNEKFAAVLGDPVEHSRTPVEHQNFFKSYGCSVFSVQVCEDEWEEALPVLQKMGMVAAAVTAPLKKKAFQSCHQLSSEAQNLQVVNTLFLPQEKVCGHNTDFWGLSKSVEKLDLGEPVVVWGGGGMLPVLEKVFKEAFFISARTGRARKGPESLKKLCLEGVRTLVWACGSRNGIQIPPKELNLERVIDLSYNEDSKAREIALEFNAKYVSGLGFFKEQAQGQRDYWQKCFEEYSIG